MKIEIPQINNLDSYEEYAMLFVYIIIGVLVYMVLSTLYSACMLPVRLYRCCKCVCTTICPTNRYRNLEGDEQ